jgi:predicted CXXCH cytochrome family protein
MDVLLRQVRQGADGTIEYQDTELSAESLLVGSAADCTIQLLGEGVAPRHATIRGARAQLSISCFRGCKVAINGTLTSAAALKVGDLAEIGGNRLRLVEPPAGFEAAIEIEANAQVDASAYEQAFRTDLNETWLSKRAAAWVLAALVLLLGFLLPLGSIAPQRAGHAATSLLPSDHFWSAGPLIPAHELAAGQHCSSCHQKIFVHVQDTACHECHKSIADHVQAARLAQTKLGPTQRCAECHREHNAITSGLVVRDDALCTDCHAKSDTRFGSLKVKPVTGFEAHPPFTVTLLKPAPVDPALGLKPAVTAEGVEIIDWQPVTEPVASAREQSNLKFRHDKHLDPAHVTRLSDGGALGCADCHTPDADGEHFVPITMQRSCGSCHDLTFDPDAPDRVLPHGRPKDSVLLIQDYFARKAVDPTPTKPPVQRRRVPDEPVVQEVSCNGPALTCAMKRAQAEIETQFTTRGCAYCHNVNDTHAADLTDRFQIAPVRLTRDYFPDVRFSHKLHSVQKDKSGDTACLSCHAVKQSKSSADVFVPDLPKCLDCHSERLTVDRVTLQCSSCHSYHPTTIIARTRETEVQ